MLVVLLLFAASMPILAETWDSGAANDNLSESDNWVGDPVISTGSDLLINSTTDSIVWDSGFTTYSSLDLASGFPAR